MKGIHTFENLVWSLKVKKSLEPIETLSILY